MMRLFEDKSEPRLFRLEAAYTLGVMHYDRQERMKCEDIYHHAITIGEKHSSVEEASQEEHCMQQVDTGRKTMKELMFGVLNDCRTNLDQLNVATRPPKGTVFTSSDNPVKRRHQMPIGRGGTTLTNEQLNNLIDVGGIQCDCCKQKDKKSFKCSICNKVFYCSKDCQKKRWREGEHKKCCREEGQFEVGDLVQCARLKNKPEMNGYLVRIVGRDETSSEERYKVQMEGAVQGDGIISIKPANLNQPRPYDCRN
jgi:hypothetical protein